MMVIRWWCWWWWWWKCIFVWWSRRSMSPSIGVMSILGTAYEWEIPLTHYPVFVFAFVFVFVFVILILCTAYGWENPLTYHVHMQYIFPILQESMERAWSPGNLQPIIVRHKYEQSSIVRHSENNWMCKFSKHDIQSPLTFRSNWVFAGLADMTHLGESKLSLFISNSSLNENKIQNTNSTHFQTKAMN